MRSDVFTVLGTKYVFVANLPVSLSAKEFRESVTFGEVMGKSLMSCFFDSRCSYLQNTPNATCPVLRHYLLVRILIAVLTRIQSMQVLEGRLEQVHLTRP